MLPKFRKNMRMRDVARRPHITDGILRIRATTRITQLLLERTQVNNGKRKRIFFTTTEWEAKEETAEWDKRVRRRR